MVVANSGDRQTEAAEQGVDGLAEGELVVVRVGCEHDAMLDIQIHLLQDVLVAREFQPEADENIIRVDGRRFTLPGPLRVVEEREQSLDTSHVQVRGIRMNVQVHSCVCLADAQLPPRIHLLATGFDLHVVHGGVLHRIACDRAPGQHTELVLGETDLHEQGRVQLREADALGERCEGGAGLLVGQRDSAAAVGTPLFQVVVVEAHVALRVELAVQRQHAVQPGQVFAVDAGTEQAGVERHGPGVVTRAVEAEELSQELSKKRAFGRHPVSKACHMIIYSLVMS